MAHVKAKKKSKTTYDITGLSQNEADQIMSLISMVQTKHLDSVFIALGECTPIVTRYRVANERGPIHSITMTKA